jgi:hypothetical protein
MKHFERVLAAGTLAGALLFATGANAAAPAAAPAPAAERVCADGTTSTAGKGACSGHGGIAKAAAKCKDGSMYTGKSRQGACSGKGGVDKWLDGK